MRSSSIRKYFIQKKEAKCSHNFVYERVWMCRDMEEWMHLLRIRSRISVKKSAMEEYYLHYPVV